MNLLLLGVGGFLLMLSGGMIAIVKIQQAMLRSLPGNETLPSIFPMMHAIVLLHMPKLVTLSSVFILFAMVRYFVRNQLIKAVCLTITSGLSVLFLFWGFHYISDVKDFLEVYASEMPDLPGRMSRIVDSINGLASTVGIGIVFVVLSAPILVHLTYFVEGRVLASRIPKDFHRVNSPPT